MSKRWIISPTQLETFLTCQRKWGYRYLDQIEVKPSKAIELGSSIHKILENYLTGKTINLDSHEGKIANAGLHFLPKSLPNENVEHHILFAEENIIFQGFIDFFEQIESQSWLIGDHKTCSSFSSALDINELKNNIQANIYAYWFFKEKEAKKVKLKWIYYRTNGKAEAKCIEVELKKEESLHNFKNILKSASEILDIVKKEFLSSELPKNTSSCFKCGPCPFYSHCKNDFAAKTPKIIEDKNIQQKPINLNDNAFHLYIDCVPTKNEIQYQRTVELSELLKPVLSQIQEEKNLSHYRLAGYGQHVGLIANYLENHLKEQEYDNHTAILSSLKTPEGCDTLQTLSKAAGRIVRGF